MHLTSAQLLLAFASLATAFCPLYGPTFPAPTGLGSSPSLRDALQNLTGILDTALTTGNTSTGSISNSGVVAAQVFSLYTEEPVWEYFHEGTTLNETGVTKVDGDSIFRIASISKLFTVYLLLKEVGDTYWDKSIIDIIPELKDNDKWKENEVDYIKWEDITLGALAGQVASLPSEYVTYSGSNPFYLDPNLHQVINLPALEEDEKPPCSYVSEGSSCTREEYFAGLDTHQPLFRTNTQPLYSNNGYIILGYAIETITGKPYREVVKSLTDALGMLNTSVAPPEASKGIIPYNETFAFWGFDTGLLAPTGGLFSSLNDLGKLGRSILNSTFLDPNTTRAWLKPTSFISDIRGAVGRPWEIYRFDTKSVRGVVDIYGKGGDVGPYHSWFCVIPDYNVGFSMVVSEQDDKDWFNANIADILLPALDVAAREEADAAYAGVYTSNADGVDTTITVTTEAGKAGLGISSWSSNGTDMIKALGKLSGRSHDSESFRLLPTNLERDLENGYKQVAWKALVSESKPNEKRSPFEACPLWFSAEETSWGSHSLDQILFNLNPEGNVASANLRAWKVELQRQ